VAKRIEQVFMGLPETPVVSVRPLQGRLPGDWHRKEQRDHANDFPIGIESRETPLLWYSVSPYFLPLEAVLVGFFAGFAFALAIATPPSFAYAPGSHAKVREVGHLPSGGSP
jgi:hypothetical protein